MSYACDALAPREQIRPQFQTDARVANDDMCCVLIITSPVILFGWAASPPKVDLCIHCRDS